MVCQLAKKAAAESTEKPGLLPCGHNKAAAHTQKGSHKAPFWSSVSHAQGAP
ncbi:hypothetical protein AA0313_1642 [Acetobacter indonesiensis NRIC 0313]|uniref:Uncharacterized protein n=1 Tax=Acetobacter indonesiensis TaxID=104101 RepID=A0A6N3T3A0_9PROT|nr:hypothetical protein Abin_002_066 [Acetobacter indonesiensis]GBQ57971.1 hypothetical protein AA0313_1642 [Acetobacter indonesiensis NRIC 0313]GEN03646.1 hypothetical protein AIN02nite_16710 [Acetobacter indonesiensis]